MRQIIWNQPRRMGYTVANHYIQQAFIEGHAEIADSYLNMAVNKYLRKLESRKLKFIGTSGLKKKPSKYRLLVI